MKKNSWLLGSIFLLSTVISCNDVLVDLNGDGITDLTEGSTLQTAVDPINATVYLPGTGAQTLDVCLNNPYKLTAGQYIDAGTVEVVNDGQNLYVTYNTTGTLGNLHLWLGTDLLDVPSTPNGVPIPGQFDLTYDASGLQHYTFVVPLADYNFPCGANLYFMAHAEVDINGNHETAFGGSTGVNIASSGRWYFYDTYTVQCCTFKVDENPVIRRVETSYAKPPKSANGNTGYVFVGKASKTNKSNPESYLGLNLTQNRWGWAVNLRTQGTYTYPVWAAAGLNNTSNGVLAGTATVTYSLSGVTVSYDLGSAGVLEEVHFYAGDLAPATIAPGQYGFTKYFDTPFSESTYTESFPVSDTNSDGVWVVLHAKVGLY